MKAIKSLADRYSWLTLALLVFALFVGLAPFWEFLQGGQYDDSYITYRYSARLAEGHGLTFNDYERTNAASSLLYTLLLSAIYKIGFHNLPLVASLLGGLLAIVCIVSLWLAVCKFVGKWVWFAAPALWLFATSGTFNAWALSGMESVMICALLSGWIAARVYARERLAFWLLAGCLLTRPEAVLLSVAVALEFVIRREWKLLGRTAVITFACVGGQFGFYWLYYGTPLSHAALFKQYAIYYHRGLKANVRAIHSYLMDYRELVYLAPLGLAFVRKHPGVVAGIAFVILHLVACVIGPYSDFGRYALPALPIVAIFASVACAKVVEWSWKKPKFRWIIAAVALLLINDQRTVVEGRRNWERGVHLQNFSALSLHQKARQEIAEYINANIPKSDLIISGDLGAIAYYAPNHQFFDAYGLTSKAPVVAAKTGDWKAYAHELIAMKPVWVADTRNARAASSIDNMRHPDKFFGEHGKPFIKAETRIVKQIGEPPLCFTLEKIISIEELD